MRSSFRRALAVALLFLSGSALAEGRVALVIGNAAYAPEIALTNPVNDANAVTEKLAKLGFKVFRVTDGDLATMARALESFSRDAKGAEAALVYYSGHGAQVAGVNYLVPVDFVIGSNADLATEALPMEKVLGALAASDAQAKLVFFDACRDNPFRTRGLSRPAPEAPASGGLAGAANGLATVKTRVPDSFIALATNPGDVALDGAGDHSPFTEAVIEHIDDPGVELAEFMRRVAASVRETTKGGQTPWTENSMTTAFYFDPAGPDAPAGAAPVEPPVPVVQVAPESPVAIEGADVIFPDSSTTPVAEEDVAGLDTRTLRIARNEIFARKGYLFSDPGLDAYFRRFSWYRPTTRDVALSDVEKRNIALFRRYELGGIEAIPVVARPDETPPVDTAPTASWGGMLVPDSDVRRLSVGDLSGFSPAELRLARNEIFARHGRAFQSADLRAHFSRFDWYRPDAGETPLSAVEKANVALIARLEKGGTAGSEESSASGGAGGFIIPDSDTRRLSPSDIAGLSSAELRLARNEIFARHGRIFKSADLRAHFSRFGWYRPSKRETSLSAVEKANVKLLQAAEQ